MLVWKNGQSFHGREVFLQNPLRGRKLEVMDVATDGHLEGASESLEDTFDLVMLVIAFCLDVEIDLGAVRE